MNVLTRNNLNLLMAAHKGPCVSVFMPMHRSGNFQQWGTFDPGTDEVHLHKKEKTDDEDLLEFTAIQTLLNGGNVYGVGAEKMPESDPFATVFRY